MAILESDIKKLWGKAAGRCSFSGCGIECVQFLDKTSPIIIGEMAHMIAKNPAGPRGDQENINNNSYDNLILLCPNHHTIVDKATHIYSEHILREMKRTFEKYISDSLQPHLQYKSFAEFCADVSKILIENKCIWRKYGPESSVAFDDPCSNMAEYWILRKLDTIVPNNQRIVSLIKLNKNLFSLDFYSLAMDFVEHAKSFEYNCYHRLDQAPRFPVKFEEEIFRHVQ